MIELKLARYVYYYNNIYYNNNYYNNNYYNIIYGGYYNNTIF